MLCEKYSDDACFFSFQENTIGVFASESKAVCVCLFFLLSSSSSGHYEFAPEDHTVKNFI
jgi:hypothetical protein